MNSADYKLGENGNRLMALMDATLKAFTGTAAASVAALSHSDAKEMAEICADGVAKFEDASDGCAPMQRVLVGAQYTLNALKEWREKGPFQE